jgi:alcohol dehydrogenase class IV
MNTFQYFLPTRIIFGRGTVASLPEYVRSEFPSARKILLVTGRTFLRSHAITDKIATLLSAYDVLMFDQVESGPTRQTLDAALAEEKRFRPDVVLGIGGGSAMDLAKAVAILARNPGTLEEYQQGKNMAHDAIPYVAVPTTTGTASEMTVWSVIINNAGMYAGKRKSFSDERMYPKLAVIDPDLTATLSPEATMGTALDILSASIESLWSKKRNPVSTCFAVQAITLALKHIPRVYADPHNLDEREQLCLASLFCGFAVSNSRTGAPHKVSYPLSSHYKVPHGAACMLSLPYFLEFIGEREPALLQDVLVATQCRSPKQAADLLRTLVRSVGFPNCLKDAGVALEDIEFIARNSYVPPQQQEDPVPMSYKEFVAILERAYSADR